MRWMVRIVVVALLVVLALKLRERQAVVAAVDDGLASDRHGIEQAEAYVDDLDARIDDAVARLRELDGQVSAFEARHPDDIPTGEREEYERLLGRRNEVVGEQNDLIARRRSAVAEYTDRVGRHNARVEDANALAQESTPWEILHDLWASVVGPRD